MYILVLNRVTVLYWKTLMFVQLQIFGRHLILLPNHKGKYQSTVLVIKCLKEPNNNAKIVCFTLRSICNLFVLVLLTTNTEMYQYILTPILITEIYNHLLDAKWLNIQYVLKKTVVEIHFMTSMFVKYNNSKKKSYSQNKIPCFLCFSIVIYCSREKSLFHKMSSFTWKLSDAIYSYCRP